MGQTALIAVESKVMKTRLDPGSVISHYEIIGKLGSGGMGEVHLARDTRLQREVAIKCLPEEGGDDPTARKRFLREARAAGGLAHPNVCAVHEIGEEDGLVYIVMQRVNGQPLSARLQRNGPLPPQEVRQIGIQVAEALAAAHAATIVHRDIKPHNIMVNSRGHVTVLDFGLAKYIQSAGAETSLTATGTAAGTVPYMSPEQLRGDELDGRTDLFSLGVVLYEAAAGRLPFEGATSGQIITAILTRDPPPPIALEQRAPDLAACVMRCLEKQPGDRYESALELLEDLGGARSTHATTVGGPRAAATRVRPLQETRAAGGRPGNDAGNDVDSLAVLPFETNSADAEAALLSDGIAESLIGNLSQLANLRVMARSTVFRYRDRELDPRVIGRELGVRNVLSGLVEVYGERLVIRAELVDVADGSVIWSGQHTRARSDVLELQQELAGKITAQLRPTLTATEIKRVNRPQTRDPEAYQTYLRGLHYLNRRDIESMRKATEVFHEALQIDPTFAAPYCGLAEAYIYFGFLEMREPLQVYPLAKAAAQKALELDPEFAEAHAALGWMKVTHEWDWPGAEEELVTSTRIKPSLAVGHHWHGLLLSYTGRFQEAEEKMVLAQSLDPLAPIINTTVGLTAYHRGDLGTAIRNYDRIADLAPGFIPLHLYRGMALDAAGRLDEAIEVLRKGLSLVPGETLLMAALGHALGAHGKEAEARAMLDELLTRRDETYTSGYGIAVVAAGLGDAELAFEWLDAAIEERAAWLCTLRVDHRWDTLRDDPRFAERIDRLGFPGAEAVSDSPPSA